MRIKVLFFGVLKEIAGAPEAILEVPENSRLGDVFDLYAGRLPRLREMAGSVVVARNRQFAALSERVQEGDEVALLPPVSGGSGAFLRESAENGNFFALTCKQIDTRVLIHRVLKGEDGAVVTFEGVVRNNTNGRRTRFLDYECYEPMAVDMMARIGRELAAQFDINRIVMVHRLGRLLIGEASVVVIVAAAHRKAAFEASLEAINRLKRLVPVWKKEYFADGEVWAEGEWDRNVPLAQRS